MLHHNPIRCRRAEKACRLCCADEMRSVCYRNPVEQELHCADNALLMQLLYRYLMAAQVLEHMQGKQWRWLSAGTLHLSPSPSKSWIDACHLNLLSQRQSWPRGREGRAQTHPRHGSFDFYFSHWRWDVPWKMLLFQSRRFWINFNNNNKKTPLGLIEVCWISPHQIASWQSFQHINLKSLISHRGTVEK